MLKQTLMSTMDLHGQQVALWELPNIEDQQAGTQTAAFVASGRVYSPTVAAKPATEEYDGSSWTSGGTLSTARYVSAQGGTLTAGLVAGGQMLHQMLLRTQKNMMELLFQMEELYLQQELELLALELKQLV